MLFEYSEVLIGYFEVALAGREEATYAGLKTVSALLISSGHIESDPGALFGLVFWKTAANYVAIKSPEIYTGVAVDVLQRSVTSFNASRVDSRSAPSYYFSFLRSCAAMA